MTSSDDLYIAVVHAHDAVLFLAAGRRSDLVLRLADWVVEQAPIHLWEDDADALGALLAHGDADGAVELYFRALEEPAARIRWERQWLVLEGVGASGGDTLVEGSTERLR